MTKTRPLWATQRDVARLANVSQAAVSRVMAQNGYVAPEVRRRIEAAALELNYKPDPMARGLVTGKSNIVALVTANVINPFFPLALDRLTDALHRIGKEVLLFNAAHDQSVDELIPRVLTYKVSGVVITTSSLTSLAARACGEAGVPVVLFHRYTISGKAHAVSSDGYAGGKQAARLLSEAGCARLAYIGGESSSSPNRDRRDGFLAGATHVGLPVLVDESEFTYEWGRKATLKLFDSGGVDGIFCGDDVIAFGALDALRTDLGLRVPEDVCVIGFDDVPQSNWSAYRLTTLSQPLDDMVEQTIKLLEMPEPAERELHLVPCELVIRDTVR
jgi:DNA-binding LacI/PurR family transcriptional regulator